MRRELALELGEGFLRAIAPVCVRAEVAGSVRRLKAEVKDVEVVVIPVMAERGVQTAMFGGVVDSGKPVSLLDLFFARGFPPGWDWDRVVKRNGPRYKRLRHVETGLVLDLFVAEARSWGGAMVIRTGPAMFSQAVVQLARRLGMCVSGGYYLHRHRPKLDEEGNEVACNGECPLIIETREEVDFLDALGLPWISPEEREGAVGMVNGMGRYDAGYLRA